MLYKDLLYRVVGKSLNTASIYLYRVFHVNFPPSCIYYISRIQ